MGHRGPWTSYRAGEEVGGSWSSAVRSRPDIPAGIAVPRLGQRSSRSRKHRTHRDATLERDLENRRLAGLLGLASLGIAGFELGPAELFTGLIVHRQDQPAGAVEIEGVIPL